MQTVSYARRVTDPIDILGALQRNLTLVVRRSSVPRAHERIISRAGLDIDRVEAIALSRIADAGAIRVTELARQMGVACSTAGRHAAHLEEGALVSRTADPDDGRVTVVSVNERGLGLVRHLRATHRDVLGEILADWDEPDIARLGELLGRLADDIAMLSEPEEIHA